MLSAARGAEVSSAGGDRTGTSPAEPLVSSGAPPDREGLGGAGAAVASAATRGRFCSPLGVCLSRGIAGLRSTGDAPEAAVPSSQLPQLLQVAPGCDGGRVEGGCPTRSFSFTRAELEAGTGNTWNN